MNPSSRTGVVSILFVALMTTSSAAQSEFRRLFDGETLRGWHGDSERWSVRDGVIVGSTLPDGIAANTFLIADGDYDDFILRVTFRHSAGASGIQIRSQSIGNVGDYRVRGYQADIGGRDLGTFYEEAGRGTLAASDFDRLAPHIVEGEWTQYEIHAVGHQFRLLVNGQLTSEYEESADQLVESGVIALQLQAGPGMEIEFKDIEIRELADESR